MARQADAARSSDVPAEETHGGGRIPSKQPGEQSSHPVSAARCSE